MQFRYFFYLLLTLLSFDRLLGYYTNSIDRALDNLFSDEINKNILIDYFDQMGSYRDWKQVTSVKLDGNIIFEDTDNSFESPSNSLVSDEFFDSTCFSNSCCSISAASTALIASATSSEMVIFIPCRLKHIAQNDMRAHNN